MVGASTFTSNSGFLYSSTRNEPPPWLGHEDLVDSQGRVRGQLERAIEAAEGVGREVPGEDLVALGILDLDREGLAGELRGVRLIVAGMRDPELEPHRLTGTIDRPVGDRVDLHLVVSRVMLTGGPRSCVKPEMGKPALGRPRGDRATGSVPWRRPGSFVGNLDLAVVVGLERQCLGLDVELVLAVHLHHPPAEKLDVRPGYGLAGAGIGDEVVRPSPPAVS